MPLLSGINPPASWRSEFMTFRFTLTEVQLLYRAAPPRYPAPAGLPSWLRFR